MANLKDIVGALGLHSDDLEIAYLSCSTADIRPNTLFIAFRGRNFDARTHILEVIAKGAVAVIYEDCADGFTPPVCSVPCFACKDLALVQSKIASVFYQHPSQELDLIGVTGTNGKSTVTHLVAQWCSLLQHKTAVMGTLGTGFYPHLTPAANTTLQALDLEHKLRDFVQAGAQAVAMEVSSHGIALKRVSELHFKLAAFTNLSRDHLDFHKTMENYANTKFQLFQMVDSSACIINIDDQTGRQFLAKLPHALAYSMKPTATMIANIPNLIYATDIAYTAHGIKFTITGAYGTATMQVPLIGSFNVQNLLCAVGIMLRLGFALPALAATSSQLQAVCGRMELFASKKALLIVDYAHTPDGLEKALQAIQEHNFGHITCICGCGGDRDKGKRPLMAKIACQMADKVIFTNDNPRTEEPQAIIADMLAGIPSATNYKVIYDRSDAIMQAYQQSKAGDVILIAGKGHEDYQIIGTVKHHYSDRELAQNLCKEEE